MVSTNLEIKYLHAYIYINAYIYIYIHMYTHTIIYIYTNIHILVRLLSVLDYHDSLTCAMTHSHVPWLTAEWCVPWVMAHIQESRAMTQSMMMCATSHVPWLFGWCLCYDLLTCAMTHSPVPWLTHMCHDSLTCAMTHSHVPWLTHICHDSLICTMTHSPAPWLTHMCHDSLPHDVCQESWNTWRSQHVVWLFQWWYDSFSHTCVPCVCMFIGLSLTKESEGDAFWLWGGYGQ